MRHNPNVYLPPEFETQREDVIKDYRPDPDEPRELPLREERRPFPRHLIMDRWS